MSVEWDELETALGFWRSEKVEKKTKLLVLHGYGQDVTSFYQRVGPFRRKAKKFGVELVFAEAPHFLPPDAPFAEGKEDSRMWFRGAGKAHPFSKERREYIGLEESFAVLRALWLKHGGFDSAIGFSQGGVLLHHWIEQQEGYARVPGRLERVGFVCAFPSRCHTTLPASTLLTTPSIHVIGEGDATVPNEVTLELTERFKTPPKILTHTKGHAFPQTSADLDTLLGFFAGKGEECEM